MDATPFQTIIESAAGFCGLDRENLAADEFADLRDYASNRLRYAWNFRPWAELEVIEERYFRPLYSADTEYSAGAEVFDPATRQYVQAIRTTTGNAPTTDGDLNVAYWAPCMAEPEADYDWAADRDWTAGDLVRNPANDRVYQCHTDHTSGATFDATKFGQVNAFERYVAYRQSGETAIGDVLNVWDRDPQKTGKARRIAFVINTRGVVVLENVATVFIEFRRQCPELMGKAWDETKEYVAGRQVYFESDTTTGNFYTAAEAAGVGESPESSPDTWTVVEIPQRLAAFVANGAAADWMADDDTQQAKAGRHDALANEFLFAEAARHDAQATRAMEVRTR